METKINLEDCYLNKETMQYCCWNQNEDGQIVDPAQDRAVTGSDPVEGDAITEDEASQT